MSELYAAMAKAFPDIEGAAKDRNNPAFKSKYADLSSVVDAIKPALVKHGLFFTQVTHEQSGGVCIETCVHHSGGESLSFGKLFVPASKNDAQGYGSALTYARRYSLMTAFGVCPEDDDGNAASKTPPVQTAPEPVITEDQRILLMTLAEQSGADMKAFCTYYQVDGLPQLPAAAFNHAKQSLERKLAAVTKKEAA